MRVCLDFQPAVAQQAGVGRYTQLLATHLASAAQDDDLSLFYFDFKRGATLTPPPGARAVAHHTCPGRLVQASWKWLGWPPFDWFAGPADVYHFPNFILPPCRKGRGIVTIHDLSFLRHPEFTEARNLAYLSQHIRRTAGEADAIITDSHFSASEIETLLSVPADRIRPIHLGIGADFAAPAAEAVREFKARQGLEKPYLLSVGTLEPRKNYEFLIDVFEKLDDFDGELVIAGMPGWKFDPILERMRTSSRASDIRYLQYVPQGGLPALYAGAELFLFPSHYEGFGFPPLEAMACGTPVLSSDAASLPEVLGNAASIVATDSVDNWVSETGILLAGGQRRDNMVERGHRQAATFRWDHTAAQTWNVYREAAV